MLTLTCTSSNNLPARPGPADSNKSEPLKEHRHQTPKANNAPAQNSFIEDSFKGLICSLAFISVFLNSDPSLVLFGDKDKEKKAKPTTKQVPFAVRQLTHFYKILPSIKNGFKFKVYKSKQKKDTACIVLSLNKKDFRSKNVQKFLSDIRKNCAVRRVLLAGSLANKDELPWLNGAELISRKNNLAYRLIDSSLNICVVVDEEPIDKDAAIQEILNSGSYVILAEPRS